jgi:galactokinase
MNTVQMKDHITSGALDERFAYIYGEAAVAFQKERYAKAINEFSKLYGEDREVGLYSVAGRSELSGNHTDHNGGCVVAAAIDLDIIAVASKRDDKVIRIKSEGFTEDTVDISAYASPVSEKFGTSGSIIAGMCAGFSKDGYNIGGFDAYTASNVLKGSGLSSSAAFEDMVGNILNYMYNGGTVANVEIAKIAQYAENEFFGKPCGLMDQVACAVGGIVAIDFADPEKPVIENVELDILAKGYDLCIVNTGGTHDDLTDDYASIPKEMKAVAAYFGKSVLREVDEGAFLKAIPDLRESVGDRAILRALHFFNENRRVAKQKKALMNGDLDAFFSEVLASGRSSFCYLQNVYTVKDIKEQGLSLALCLAEGFLAEKKAAWRVHGGGFAGTIQAFVPMSETEGFCALMESVFGEKKCIVLRIRPVGATKIA